MATDSAARSVTNTLSGTSEDVVTLTQRWPAIEVTNHDASIPLYIRQDGTTAVSEADNTTVIPAGLTKVIKAEPTAGTDTIVISIVGDGNKYTIEGVN